MSDKKVRIQFDLSEEGAEELNRLMDVTGVATRKDLMNNALTLFKWAVTESRAGRSIAAVDEEKQSYRELTMPALQRELAIH